jgi:hypothetical protein
MDAYAAAFRNFVDIAPGHGRADILLVDRWAVGLTYFVTLLPISINGLGVQELSLTFMLTHFGGITEPTALTLAFLIRILQMFASLPGAFCLPDVVVGEERIPA